VRPISIQQQQQRRRRRRRHFGSGKIAISTTIATATSSASSSASSRRSSSRIGPGKRQSNMNTASSSFQSQSKKPAFSFIDWTFQKQPEPKQKQNEEDDEDHDDLKLPNLYEQLEQVKTEQQQQKQQKIKLVDTVPSNDIVQDFWAALVPQQYSTSRSTTTATATATITGTKKQPSLVRNILTSTNQQQQQQQQEQQQQQQQLHRRNDMTLGAVMSIGVLYILAWDTNDSSNNFFFFEEVTTNIVDTAVPKSAYDVVTVALGETVAGFTGALASLSLKLIVAFVQTTTALQKSQQPSTDQPPPSEDTGSNTAVLLSQRVSTIQEKSQIMINQAAAETDYFLARAAVLPLLVEGVGLSPALATLASSLVATLPYQVVKLGKQQKDARQEENQLLQRLLIQQQQKDQQQRQQQELQQQQQQQQQYWKKWMKHLLRKPTRTITTTTATETTETFTHSTDPSKLQPIQKEMENVIDVVELFADTCKWLSYSVLMNNFSGLLTWQQLLLPGGATTGTALTPMMTTGVAFESGFYGLLATLTSQIYADFLYYVVRVGPKSKQEQVRARRTGTEWFLLYANKSIQAFTLFGVYAGAQIPVRIIIDAFLSGGIDSCIGSVNVDICMDTYYLQNPPLPPSSTTASSLSSFSVDPEAQFRAIVTTVYSFAQMLTQLEPQNNNNNDYMYSAASIDAQIRAILTTLASLFNRIFS